VEAEAAEQFSIAATGRNADLCSRIENNLILETYTGLLARQGKKVQPLAIRMHNQIPLGMGCGSSAAGRLAAIALAVHFGELGWSSDQILAEACAEEGHPDNAAACWLGGLVIAACEDKVVHAARVEPPLAWRALVVMPDQSLATSEARAVLPESYSRADAIANVQAASLLGLAFAQGRGELLRPAMSDRIHQPYRAEMCPLLPLLLPLAGNHGIFGVALSGAGPSVLLIVSGDECVPSAKAAIQKILAGVTQAEILTVNFESNGARDFRK
jgi:homoserine kinase